MLSRFEPPRPSGKSDHGVVFREKGSFCGMPFISGLWRAADGSLVAGFKRIPVNYSDHGDIHHDSLAVSRGKIAAVRSVDNGITWDPKSVVDVFDLSSSADSIPLANADSSEESVDFRNPDVLVASGGIPALFVPNADPWLVISTDGGRSWRPPVRLHKPRGIPSLSGQGSFVVRPDGIGLLALTAVTEDGWKRRPLLYASADGVSWNFLCFMTPEEDDGQAVSDRTGSPRFGAHRYFYPRPLVLRDGRLIATMRCQLDPTSILWTEMFESCDGGRTWQFLSRVNDWGAPSDICELSDGRIVCVYGYRLPPYGVRYRVSEDGGRTWGAEVILRSDGGSWDLGYPRVCEVEAGTCLAIYYFNKKDDPVQLNGGIRHIARTRFVPE